MKALTERETEYVSLLAEGLSEEAIRQRMKLNEVAISSHRSRVQRKLGLSDITQIRLWASPISDARLKFFLGRSLHEPLG